MVKHEFLKTNKHIILFDGVCNLCSGFLQFVYKRDRKRIYQFVWIQEEIGKQILKQLALPAGQSDTIVLVAENKAYTKSTAFLRITAHLKFPWPMLTLGYLIPAFIRDMIYDWVAKNRYDWFGKKDSCMIPAGELSERFLSAKPSAE